MISVHIFRRKLKRLDGTNREAAIYWNILFTLDNTYGKLNMKILTKEVFL